MFNRTRRLRTNKVLRDMVRENKLSTENFIYPLFFVEGNNIKEEISTMPGVFHFSVDMIKEELNELISLGIKKVLVFGVPNHKDSIGSESFNDEGIVQMAVKEIKKHSPDMFVITDVCMCQYTDHGHCGILSDIGVVKNDITLDYLSKIALSHALSGADMVAPSDMMDGRVSAIRQTLDNNGFKYVSIMAYSAKYASNFYGPFREAAHSAPSFGDRKTYQMDFSNSDEALIEIESDIEEGADIIMVKPALSYLDIIRRAKDNFNIPIAAYNVSGEYSMIKNAISQGLVSDDIIYEIVLSIKRAGAGIIITYFAKELAKKINNENL
ncbi:porphobilinogen synthase [Helicovermis profundi]|uniref:Delta-aminolevulinic acid dehydratase n=1 Tax=Helicovermis profundi TaxID=3065157 RepID=A0AAU9E2Q3_9FIRM|nr:porphobilinogen synthase [Clostridia bacterium S502]